MKMIEPISWEQFRKDGFLWLINQQLHLFGLAIVVDIKDETKQVIKAYPARCKFRGFDPQSNDNGYQAITEYLLKNISIVAPDIEAIKAKEDIK